MRQSNTYEDPDEEEEQEYFFDSEDEVEKFGSRGETEWFEDFMEKSNKEGSY